MNHLTDTVFKYYLSTFESFNPYAHNKGVIFSPEACFVGHLSGTASSIEIMQNKPNFMKNPANVSYHKSRSYKNTPPVFSPKIPKPISPSVQMNLTLAQITSYHLPVTNYHDKNKPNSNPIQTQFKPNSNPTYDELTDLDFLCIFHLA